MKTKFTLIFIFLFGIFIPTQGQDFDTLKVGDKIAVGDTLYGGFNIYLTEYDTVDVKTYVTYKGKPACPNCNTGEWETIYRNTRRKIPTTDITIWEHWIYDFNGLYSCMAMCNNCGNLFVYKSYRLVKK